MNNDDIAAVMAMAAGLLLKEDEGILIHYQGEGYIVYRDSESGEIRLVEEPNALKAPHGQMVWMHGDNSMAPEPLPGEPWLDDDEQLKH